MLRKYGLFCFAMAVAAVIGAFAPSQVVAEGDSTTLPHPDEVADAMRYFPQLDWPGFVIPEDIPFVDPASPNAQAVALANKGIGEQALTEFLTLAEEGFAPAMVNAGILLYRGQIVDPDYAKALDLVKRAQAAGDPIANLALGNMLYDGIALPRDLSESVRFLKVAANGPARPEAEWSLAFAESQLTADTELAIEHCLEAYSQGHRIAIEQCQDMGPFMLSDFITPRVNQTKFAISLAPWHHGTNISKQYIQDIFGDTDARLTRLMTDAIPGYRKYYDFDVEPFLPLIGRSSIRAADLVAGGSQPSDGSVALESTDEPAPVGSGRSQDVETVISRHVSEICETGPATLREGALYEPDLDMDGDLDMVLDLGFVDCAGGDRSDTCGFRTCRILILFREGPELKLIDTLTSIGAEVVGNAPPRIKLMTHDFEEYEVAWDGSRLSEVDVDAESTPETISAVSGSWQYGDHPILGLSAHIEVGTESIGITCAYHGDNPAVVGLSSIRVTPGLVRNGRITMLLQPSRAGGTNRLSPGDGFFEVTGNSCDLNTLEWRNGSSVAILDTEITGVSSVADGVLFDFEDGRTLSPEESLEDKFGVLTVPLKGSARAIDQLLNACPMLRQDIEWNCGI